MAQSLGFNSSDFKDKGAFPDDRFPFPHPVEDLRRRSRSCRLNLTSALQRRRCSFCTNTKLRFPIMLNGCFGNDQDIRGRFGQDADRGEHFRLQTAVGIRQAEAHLHGPRSGV